MCLLDSCAEKYKLQASFPERVTLPFGACEYRCATLKYVGSVRSKSNCMQAVEVQCPKWAMRFLQRPPHVTVSMAEGVKARTAGDLVRKVKQGRIYGVEHELCMAGIT